MSENKPAKLRELSAEEIREKMKAAREELFNLGFRNSVKQLDNPLKIREVRRDLARYLTLLKEHESGIRPLTGHHPGAAK
ncbi:MAG: 50S ribosomal protein L29 [Candidatus Eisenbacteria bacterium]|nr:50S ribosomal protein L29 [Candidatus Eisenbacteria bacterium]